MVNSLDFLLDDGAGIEIGGDVVTGGSDEFNAALVCLAVGICTSECWEEGVMDVDDLSEIFRAEFLGKYLHETGKDNELDVLCLQKFSNLIESMLAFYAIHFDVVEGYVRSLG